MSEGLETDADLEGSELPAEVELRRVVEHDAETSIAELELASLHTDAEKPSSSSIGEHLSIPSPLGAGTHSTSTPRAAHV